MECLYMPICAIQLIMASISALISGCLHGILEYFSHYWPRDVADLEVFPCLYTFK